MRLPGLKVAKAHVVEGRNGSTALLIVDVQRDFLSGGALAVPEGDSVMPVLAGSAAIPCTCWRPVSSQTVPVLMRLAARVDGMADEIPALLP